MVLFVSDNIVLWRLTKRAVSGVTALLFIFSLMMQVMRWDMVLPAAEKAFTTPLKPTVAEISRVAARACCRVQSPAGDLCLLDFPSKGNRASRSRSVGAELQLINGGHPPPGPHDFIKLTVTHHAKLIEAMEEMKAEHKSDMEAIKSEMEKIISGLHRHAGEFKDLKNEVKQQGTIQRLVICAVLISTMALGFLVRANYDKWMNRACIFVKVWAGEALYEFTGGWFGKKAS